MSVGEEAFVDNVSAISRLKYANAEDALREVAEQILAGNNDPLFRLMLANMIHPDRPPVRGRKLVLKGQRRAPPKARNWALEEFIELQVDIHEIPTKIAFHEASVKFGVSRTIVTEALARSRADRDEDSFERYRASMLDLAEAGHPDYQPVWSPER